MKLIRVALLITLTTVISFNSMAWGLLGHRIVGQIAESYLTRRAQKEVRNILGGESIAMCSNWADFIKSNPAYSYLYNWHFINLKSGMDSAAVKNYLDQDTVIDAYTKINFLATQLKDRSLPMETKGLYLRMLVHIVGDIHQPLHIGRPEDKGGNTIRVLWFRDSVNLHQVWDERLIAFQQLSYTEYATAINNASKDLISAWKSESISQWIWQSYQIAEKIYAEIKQPNQKLEYKYNYDYYDILNRQLLKGGVHLAALLNEIFG